METTLIRELHHRQFYLFLLYVCQHLPVGICTCITCIQCLKGQKRVTYPRPEVIGCCELSWSFWESNRGPLKEQNLPLISEPSHQSLHESIKSICKSRNWFYNPSRISLKFKAIHCNIFYKSKRQKKNQKQHQQEGEQ